MKKLLTPLLALAVPLLFLAVSPLLVATPGCGGPDKDAEDATTEEDSASGDTTQEDVPADSADDPCQRFCDLMWEFCPDDTACVHSCEEEATVNPPPSEAFDCLGDATDCDSASQCWTYLFP
ncbi:MAG: hypothetical protein ABIJ56_02620 [Pseudomonadota bacterium]